MGEQAFKRYRGRKVTACMWQLNLVWESNLLLALHPLHNECFLSVHYIYFVFPQVACLLALILQMPLLLWFCNILCYPFSTQAFFLVIIVLHYARVIIRFCLKERTSSCYIMHVRIRCISNAEKFSPFPLFTEPETFCAKTKNKSSPSRMWFIISPDMGIIWDLALLTLYERWREIQL